MSNGWTNDAAYGYMFASKVNINEGNYADDGTPASGASAYSLEGAYDNSAAFRALVTKRF